MAMTDLGSGLGLSPDLVPSDARRESERRMKLASIYTTLLERLKLGRRRTQRVGKSHGPRGKVEHDRSVLLPMGRPQHSDRVGAFEGRNFEQHFRKLNVGSRMIDEYFQPKSGNVTVPDNTSHTNLPTEGSSSSDI